MQARPEGCTFHHPFTSQIPNIHLLSIQREDISIHLSPIRINLSPTHLHQGTQTNSRKMGIQIIIYLDVMLIMSSTFKRARENILTLKYILESLGFLINLEKSIFTSVQVIEFLGILVDSTNMWFLLPKEKVAAIQKECRHLVSRQVASLSQLSHIIRTLTSCKIAVLQAPLYYRGIQHWKNSKPLTHALEDLRWWAENIPLANGRPIWNSLLHLVSQSDASNSRWGAVSNGVHTRGTWTQSSYQLQGTVSSIICSENLHQKSSKCPCGGSQKVPPRSLCTTSVELLSREKNHSKGRPHPRLFQHNSRHGIESQTRHIRLASEPELLSEINGQARSVYDRPFCK